MERIVVTSPFRTYTLLTIEGFSLRLRLERHVLLVKLVTATLWFAESRQLPES